MSDRMAEVRHPDGTIERAGYLDVGGAELAWMLHLPAGAPTSVALVCSPPLAEFMQNYNREALLARRLATRGVAVARFHGRGVGDSDGELADLGFERMVEDATAVAHAAATTTRAPVGAVIGTRIAGLVAAAVAARTGAGRLVLWEPVEAVDRMLSQMSRARKLVAMAGLTDAEDPDGPLAARLREHGAVDVLGTMVPRVFVESFSGRTVTAELDGHQPVTLVIVGGDGKEAKQGITLAEGLTAAGLDASLVTVSDAESWWLLAADDPLSRRGRSVLASEITEATTSFLATPVEASL